jgi:hypothetical protein
MTRKIISFITLVFFLHFTLSCIIRTYQRTEVEKLSGLRQGKDILTVRVEKKSGEWIEFSKDRPGLLAGDKIVVPSETRSQKRIDKADIEKKYRRWGEPSCIVTKDGKTYEVVRILSETKDRVVILTYDPEGTIIPLSEVNFIWIRKVNYLLTALAIVVPVAAILALFAASWDYPAMDLSGLF